MKKRILSAFLACSLIFSMFFGTSMTASADSAITVALNKPQYTDTTATKYTFKNAIVSDCSGITSITFTATGRTTVASVPDSPNPSNSLSNIDDGTTRVYTYVFGGIGSADAQSFIRGVVFNYVADAQISVLVDANATNLPAGTAGAKITKFTPSGEESAHYYMFVSSDNITWSDAYNEAKGYSYMGMRGYLATITSEAEDNILRNISTTSAWSAGTRYLDTNFDKLADPGSVSVTSDTATADYYYWACGPEAGTVYYDSSSPSSVNGPTTTEYGTYNNWGTGQPDADTTEETCMQVNWPNDNYAYGQMRWNDLPNNDRYPDCPVHGYFMEFSNYGGGIDNSYSINNTATNLYNIPTGGVTQIAAVTLNAPANLVYNGTAKAYTAEVSGASLTAGTDYTLTYTGRNSTNYDSSTTAPTNVGDYTVNFALTDSGQAKCVVSEALTSDFTVTPATLTVTPNGGQTKYSGSDDPVITYTYSGNISGETPDFSGALSRDPGDTVGEYVITQGNLTLTDNTEGFLASNYALAFSTTPVNFTVYAALTYGISLSQSSKKVFTGTTEGYDTQTPYSVTVSNTGTGVTGSLTAAMSGTDKNDFTLSKTDISSIDEDGSDSFTVVPQTGLSTGTYTATVTVSGDSVTSKSFDVSFTVSVAVPSITTTSLTGGIVGTAYSQTLAATNSPTSWSVSFGNLPAGLSLDASTGVISGTPTTAASYTFGVTATNATGSSTEQSLTITVSVAVPSVKTNSLPGGVAGTAYLQTLAATNSPTSWIISSGNLPAGLSLNTSTGVISGTPTTVGSNTFGVTATNATGSSTGKSLTITVNPVPPAPPAPPTAAPVVISGGNQDISGNTNPSNTATIMPNDANSSAVSDITVNLPDVTITAPPEVVRNAIGTDDSSWLKLSQDTPTAEAQQTISTVAAALNLSPVNILDVNLTRYYSDGRTEPIHQLSASVTVTIRLTAAQIAAIKSPQGARLFYFDPSTHALTDMNAAFDLTKGTATFPSGHFSIFVIATAPLVTGIVNNGIYNRDQTITFDRGTATLDGSPFTSGGTVTTEGKHTLVVTDTDGTSTTLVFTIDKTAPNISGVDNDGIYYTDKTISFNEGNATLDGSTFTSGGTVNSEGEHTLVVTDEAGNVTTVKFIIDKTAPVVTAKAGITFVKNNGVTASSVTVSASGKFRITKSVTLNGNALVWPANGVFTKEGKYSVTVRDQYGRTTKTTFTIKKPTVQVKVGVTYSAHVQIIAWQKPVSNGKAAGTTGERKRLEALKINLTGNLPKSASISYQVYVTGKGWMTGKNGTIAGTVGQKLRVEAVRMTVNGLAGYVVQYKLHIQNNGWQKNFTKTKNGTSVSSAAIAGKTGSSLRVEAIEIQVTKNA